MAHDSPRNEWPTVFPNRSRNFPRNVPRLFHECSTNVPQTLLQRKDGMTRGTCVRRRVDAAEQGVTDHAIACFRGYATRVANAFRTRSPTHQQERAQPFIFPAPPSHSLHITSPELDRARPCSLFLFRSNSRLQLLQHDDDDKYDFHYWLFAYECCPGGGRLSAIRFDGRSQPFIAHHRLERRHSASLFPLGSNSRLQLHQNDDDDKYDFHYSLFD